MVNGSDSEECKKIFLEMLNVVKDYSEVIGSAWRNLPQIEMFNIVCRVLLELDDNEKGNISIDSVKAIVENMDSNTIQNVFFESSLNDSREESKQNVLKI